MGLACINNTQHIELFDEEQGCIWGFHLNWHNQSIHVSRNEEQVAEINDARFPPQQQYLEQLTNQLSE